MGSRRGIQSRPTARPAPRMISREWLLLPNPDLIHNHPGEAVKNWALRLTDGHNRLNQNRRMTAQNRSRASLAT